MTTAKRKPVSYWAMLVIVFIAFISVAATSKAEKTTAIDKTAANIEVAHIR